MNLLKSGQDVPEELVTKEAASEQRAKELQQQASSTPSKAAGDGRSEDSTDVNALKHKVSCYFPMNAYHSTPTKFSMLWTW